jgi:hypothetical protein
MAQRLKQMSMMVQGQVLLLLLLLLPPPPQQCSNHSKKLFLVHPIFTATPARLLGADLFWGLAGWALAAQQQHPHQTV